MTKVERFCEAWSNMLWGAMHRTQRGVRLNRMGNSGRGEDRRADKLVSKTGEPPKPVLLRRYQARYPVRYGK